jgi:hypothetical protein
VRFAWQRSNINSALAKREVKTDEARLVFLNIFSQILGVEFEVVENPHAQGGILG